MAVITSASSGNFSAPATWVGGVVPTSVDDAVAATTHVVTIDVDVTVLSFQQAGTGKFVLGNGRTVTGNVIANAGTFASGGTMEVNATTTAVINGNITALATASGSIAAIVITGTGTITINGNITGSPTNVSFANANAVVYTNVTNTINVNGIVSGGTGQEKRGLQCGASSSSTINVVGRVVGTHGALNSDGAAILTYGNNSTINVTGDVLTGTVGWDSFGIRAKGNGTIVNVTGNTILYGAQRSFCIQLTGTTSTLNLVGDSYQIGTSGVSANIGSTGSATTVINVTGNLYPVSVSSLFVTVNGASLVNIIGSVYASNVLFAHGVEYQNSLGGSVNITGNMFDSTNGVVAVWTRTMQVNGTVPGVTKYASGPNNPFGTLVSRVDPANSAGMPTTTSVRSGTVYGASSEFTGTVAVPSAGQTMYGVPVDGTTGTAVFDLQQVADIVELQVSAGAYERTSL